MRHYEIHCAGELHIRNSLEKAIRCADTLSRCKRDTALVFECREAYEAAPPEVKP